MLHRMTRDGVLSVLLITHKFREIMRFADSYTVLRNGKVTGSGAVCEVSPKHLAELMIGNEDIAAPTQRRAGEPALWSPRYRPARDRAGRDRGRGRGRRIPMRGSGDRGCPRYHDA